MDLTYSTRLADWAREGALLTRIRFTVFVEEQGVPAALELDSQDADPDRVQHVVAHDGRGEVIATGRMVLAGEVPRIGRMAVLRDWRGRGVGGAMLNVLVAEAARREFREVMLHSQSHATAFYARHGFVPVGTEFIEAGIAHREMRRALQS